MPFGEVPVVPKSKSGGLMLTLKSLYYDPFKWQIVKSWAFFVGGVVIARELAAIDLSSGPAINI